MDTAVQTAIATVIATVVTASAAYLTQRSASKAAVRNAQVTSMADLEKEAGERAARIYQGAITQLERENQEHEEKIGRLEQTVDEQAGQIRQLRRELDTAKDELDTAKRALQLKYPDED